MHLYNPETQQMLNTAESVAFTNALQVVWNDMMKAGVPAVEAACFMSEHAGIFRCEEILVKMTADWRKKKEAQSTTKEA